MDWVIQKATELGLIGIAPVLATHSVVRPRADRIEHQLARWQRIALEAAQQSERWSVPVNRRTGNALPSAVDRR